jgi:hypothetical protein
MIYIDPPGLHCTYSGSGFMADFRECEGMEKWKQKAIKPKRQSIQM